MQYLPFLYIVAMGLALSLQILLKRLRAAMVIGVIATATMIVFLIFGQEYHAKVGGIPVMLLVLLLSIVWLYTLYGTDKLSRAVGER